MLKFSLSFLTFTETLMRLLYTVCLWFSNIIYGTAAAVYSLFYKIVQLSSPEFRNVFSSLNGLIDRLKLFIGLFIMFKIIIILINSIVDPEAKEGLGSASNYIWRIVLIVGMLIAYPFAFSYLDEAQSVLMGVGSDQGNVIARIFLGTEAAESVTGADAGKRLMNEVYLSFFHVGDTNFVYSSSNCEGQYGSQGYLCEVYEGESISYLNEQGLFDDTNVKWEYPVLSGLVGVLFIVIFVQYCFDTAGRLFLLLLLQVLAPIPIICYIDPKEGKKILSSYIKHYATSYFELFFNVSLMFVSMALCKTVSNVSAYIFSLWQSTDALSSITNCLVVIILYISLFMTIKKLPKIIDEIFGTNLGGSLKDKFSAGIKTVGFATNLAKAPVVAGWSAWKARGLGAGQSLRAGVEGLGGQIGNSFKNINKPKSLKDAFSNETAKGTIKNVNDRMHKYDGWIFSENSALKKNWQEKVSLRDQVDKDRELRYNREVKKVTKAEQGELDKLIETKEKFAVEYSDELEREKQLSFKKESYNSIKDAYEAQAADKLGSLSDWLRDHQSDYFAAHPDLSSTNPDAIKAYRDEYTNKYYELMYDKVDDQPVWKDGKFNVGSFRTEYLSSKKVRDAAKKVRDDERFLSLDKDARADFSDDMFTSGSHDGFFDRRKTATDAYKKIHAELDGTADRDNATISVGGKSYTRLELAQAIAAKKSEIAQKQKQAASLYRKSSEKK